MIGEIVVGCVLQKFLVGNAVAFVIQRVLLGLAGVLSGGVVKMVGVCANEPHHIACRFLHCSSIRTIMTSSEMQTWIDGQKGKQTMVCNSWTGKLMLWRSGCITGTVKKDAEKTVNARTKDFRKIDK